MMLYLDNQQNRAGNLNENYSREVMELFTIGQGHYTEQDVQEGARALTGWTINPFKFRSTGVIETTFVARRHDPGVKTYLGHEGKLKAEDVVEILANHPSTAPTLSAKLWSRFAYPQPPLDLVQRLADVFTSQNRNIVALVDAIFSAPEFSSDRAYRSRIKSPLDFTLGALRQLEIQADHRKVLQSLRSMGQLPYGAASVKGWPDSWLDSMALLHRITLADQMTQDYGDEGSFSFPADRFQPQDLLKLLVDGNPPPELASSMTGLSPRESAALILASPTYQLA
jgi:uncharacterized protein (DUF1800 family)